VVAANVELVADATVIGGLPSDFLDIAGNARDLKHSNELEKIGENSSARGKQHRRKFPNFGIK
jgi:hypothetical protein